MFFIDVGLESTPFDKERQINTSGRKSYQ